MCKKKLTFVFITAFSIFSLKSKFGIESLSSLVQDVFFRKKLNSTQNRPISTIRAVSKDMKTKRKFYRQSCSWYFETLRCSTKFSFDCYWKKALFIVVNMVYASCLTSCWTTYDLGSEEIGKYQENLQTLWNYSLVLSLPPKMKILWILTKNSWKIDIELFS